MKKVLLNHASISSEIIKSKHSYCYFLDARYAVAEHSYDTLKDAMTAPKGSVVRVQSWAHIPLSDVPNLWLTGEARNRVRLNFKPFSHYLITDSDPVEVGRSHWKGDLDTGRFSSKHGRLTPRLGYLMLTLVERLGYKANFRRYSYRDEMIGDALTALCANALKYDEMKGTSAFGYLTTIAGHEMVKRLKAEKAAQSTRDDLLESVNGKPSISRQMEGELARFEPVLLKRTKRRPRSPDFGCITRFAGVIRSRVCFALSASGFAEISRHVGRTGAIGGALTILASAIGTRSVVARRIHGARPPITSFNEESMRAKQESNATLLPEIEKLHDEGIIKLTDIATALSERGYTAPSGKPWSISKIHTVLKSVPLKERRERNCVPRSQEAIASASAKLRLQREARVAAVLPLIEEARANGCQLLREICAYLDKIGHRPPQGERWAVPTLSQILPRPTDDDREARDAAFEAKINEAQAGGHYKP